MVDASPLHAAILAAIHGAAFPAGERWDEAAIATLLRTPGSMALLDERGGFVMARRGGGETELLTVAVLPAARRQGVARALLAALTGLHGGPVFLEVAADNVAARGLYDAAGFEQCGVRPNYYGPSRHALVLRWPTDGATALTSA